MLDEETINTVIKYLTEGRIDIFNQEKVKERIKNVFQLDDTEADKIYKMLNKINE